MPDCFWVCVCFFTHLLFFWLRMLFARALKRMLLFRLESQILWYAPCLGVPLSLCFLLQYLLFFFAMPLSFQICFCSLVCVFWQRMLFARALECMLLFHLESHKYTLAPSTRSHTFLRFGLRPVCECFWVCIPCFTICNSNRMLHIYFRSTPRPVRSYFLVLFIFSHTSKLPYFSLFSS